MIRPSTVQKEAVTCHNSMPPSVDKREGYQVALSGTSNMVSPVTGSEHHSVFAWFLGEKSSSRFSPPRTLFELLAALHKELVRIPTNFVQVSARAIRHRLQENGMSTKRPLLQFPLTENRRCLRRYWCDGRPTRTSKWDDIVFTDEYRF
ncbi:hypothetical protein TNCV_4028641 [Trichonephila clavipes]|nr:hypothetical protein TNCV_4028641 [Trichonephila clavipes]